ncbi:3D domain-containing protein [Burkholderia stabilis]|uniref:3D domain-containing protein n=1 Tax=Burkholderia stabilis TaxID=95485 RepID=UPI001F4BB67D|nr:3D domain-containing protein [Burkholderia stabilis]
MEMPNDIVDLPGFSCSTGWRITGYYLPAEADFQDPASPASVTGWGEDSFSAKFLDACRMEGWGETRYGWFLGWSDGHWVKSDFAKDARDGHLEIGCVAVDVHMIPLGTVLRIPTAPAPWCDRILTAADTGGGIKDKHIDIFCGFGDAARQETYRVTAGGGTVCVSANAAL